VGICKAVSNVAAATAIWAAVVAVLAVFANDNEAEIWEQKWKLTGERVNKKFNEARDIAVSKPNVYGLGLQVNANTATIHWVR
jgi:hypothetical protein